MIRTLRTLILVLASGCSLNTTATSTALSWVTGYWFSPTIYGRLPVSDIDFDAVTHIIHYHVMPASDGTLERRSLSQVVRYAPELIETAHRNNVRVLLGVAETSVGGDFMGATHPQHLDAFVSNLMDLVETYGYDGIDIDWEHAVDPSRFTNLVTALRKRLDALPVRGLLAGAFWEVCCALRELQDAFDQINVMTYDNCSPADGFTFHNAALYNLGDPRQRTVEWRMRQFLAVLPARKLGLGIPLYGYVWRGGSGTSTGGVTLPAQTWTVAPTMTAIDYRVLARDPQLWREVHKRRDQPAGNVPYLSISDPDPARSAFVTYDDEVSIAQKVLYATGHGLGGVMVYELSADYFPGETVKHPLLQAVRRAAGLGSPTAGEAPPSKPKNPFRR